MRNSGDFDRLARHTGEVDALSEWSGWSNCKRGDTGTHCSRPASLLSAAPEALRPWTMFAGSVLRVGSWACACLLLAVALLVPDARADVAVRLAGDMNTHPNLDFNAFIDPFGPGPMVEHAGALYAVGYTPETGRELFVVPEGESQARLAIDLTPGPASSNIYSLVSSDGPLYFIRHDAQGSQIWALQPDGQAVQLTSFDNTGINSYGDLATVGSVLVFRIQSEVWRAAPGTTTQRLSAHGKSASGAMRLGDGVLFTQRLPTSNSSLELWRTEGSLETNELLISLPSQVPLVDHAKTLRVHGGDAWLLAEESIYQTLVHSDGTPAGTRIVHSSTQTLPGGSIISAYGNLVYFARHYPIEAPDTVQLWRSDGTESGTQVIAVRPKAAFGGSPFAGLTALDGGAIFAGSGTQLEFANGIDEGVVHIDGEPFYPSNSYPDDRQFVRAAGRAIIQHHDNPFFGAFSVTPASDGAIAIATEAGLLLSLSTTSADGLRLFVPARPGTTPVDIWTSDGTAAGTGPFAEIWAGTASSNWPPVDYKPASWLGDRMYASSTFPNCPTDQCPVTISGLDVRTGVTVDLALQPAGLVNPSSPALVGDRIAFTAGQSDGMGGVAHRLFHASPALDDIQPVAQAITSVGLLGSVADAALTYVLFPCVVPGPYSASLCAWSQPGGSRVVLEHAGGDASTFSFVGYHQGTTLFFAFGTSANNNGDALWRTDGTLVGTTPVATLDRCATKDAFAVVAGQMTFCARQGMTTGLWRFSPGSGAVNQVRAFGGQIDSFSARNDRLALRHVAGWQHEFWISDLTPEGTELFLATGPAGGPTWVGERLHVAGQGYWISDGTLAGTWPLSPHIEAASAAPRAVPYAVTSGSIHPDQAVFACSGPGGMELCSVNGDGTGLRLIEIYPGPAGSYPVFAGASGPHLVYIADHPYYGREPMKIVGDLMFADSFEHQP